MIAYIPPRNKLNVCILCMYVHVRDESSNMTDQYVLTVRFLNLLFLSVSQNLWPMKVALLLVEHLAFYVFFLHSL